MAAGLEPGVVRLVYTDANQSNERLAWEGRTEEFLKADQATVQEMEQNPTMHMSALGIGEDDLLLVKFKPDAADGVDLTDCLFKVPIQRKNITTGVLWEDLLTQASFTAPTSAGALGTGVYTEIARYTCPAQQRIRAGHVISDQRVDSKLQLVVYDDTA
jgi:hypothetical protein